MIARPRPAHPFYVTVALTIASPITSEFSISTSLVIEGSARIADVSASGNCSTERSFLFMAGVRTLVSSIVWLAV